MKLTRVEAASMQEALWKIRSTLGEDTEIVGTRTFRRGGLFGMGSREVVEVYVTDQAKKAETVVAEQPASRLEAHVPREAPQNDRSRETKPEVEHLSKALGNLRREIHDLA